MMMMMMMPKESTHLLLLLGLTVFGVGADATTSTTSAQPKPSCCDGQGSSTLFWTLTLGSTFLVLYLWLASGKKKTNTPHELPNGMLIHGWAQFETKTLYEEIFEKACYRDGGIELKRGDTIVDAGANIGMFSLWAYRECQGDADVYAFEPIPSTYEVLERNASAYGNGRIRAFNHGLGTKEEDVIFEHHPNASIWSTSSNDLAEARAERITQDMATIFTGSKQALRFIPRFVYVAILKLVMKWVTRKEKVQCHLKRLGDVIEQEGVQEINLLKVDVEGAEFSVLEGVNENQWETIRQVALEVESFERVYQIRDFLRGKGYHVYWRASEREDGKEKTGTDISSEVCMLYAMREPSVRIKADETGYILKETKTSSVVDESSNSETGEMGRRRKSRHTMVPHSA